MRLAFSGAACTGKSTVLRGFLQQWPKYKVPEPSYRSLITAKKHSKNTTAKIQKQILEFMVNQQSQFTLHDNVAYDRCVLDNIIYSVWAFDKGKKGFTDKFIEQCIPLVQKGMRNLDIIFFMTRDDMGPVEDNNFREIDPQYVAEIDNLFKATCSQLGSKGASPFFPHNDSPALIELKGTVEERLQTISMYITPEGNMYGEDQSLINTEEIYAMEKLLREQQGILKKEKGIL